MLDSTAAFLMEKQPDIQKTLGAHKISIVHDSFGVVSDMAIANQQKVVLSDIATMKKDVSDAKKELTDRKKVLGIVDQWILSIRDRNKRQFTSDEALELTRVAAKMAAGKESLKEICLIGCDLKKCSLEVCKKIKERMEEEGIRTIILNNVLYDAQMLEELADVKGAFLVANAGSTLCSEIAEELELIKRQGIKVLVGIVVE